jgi:hypothetical protein
MLRDLGPYDIIFTTMCGVVIVAMAMLLKNLGLMPSVYVGW